MKKKLCKLVLAFLLYKLNVFAQTAGFRYEATIQPVDSSGFYNIVLTPELNAHLQVNYSDVRIVNDSGKWVPHLVYDPSRRTSKQAAFSNMKIMGMETEKANTAIQLLGDSSSISNIRLVIRNTAAKRYCTLSGSDDGSFWFVINDSIELQAESNMDNNSFADLFFPAVNYRYYKIVINNNGKEPLNILSAQTKGLARSPGKLYQMLENPLPAVVQKDSNKISYIKVQQGAPYHFNKFSLKISGVKYFNRQAALYIPSSANHSFANPGAMVQSFTISNNSTLEFGVPESNASAFYIVIQNDDNLPLKIEQVKTFADYKMAAVYLDKGRQYTILLDNAGAVMPAYDISLKDIPADNAVPIVVPQKITALPNASSAAVKKGDSKKMIWLIIVIAAIVLSFFTYRLIKDMNQSKT